MSRKYLPWINYGITTFFVVFQFLLQSVAGIMSNAWMIDFNLNKAEVSYLSASFFISYVLLQIPVGIAYDKLGARKVLIMASLLLMLGIWGFAYSLTYTQALCARVLMGAGSAFGFIGMLYITASWFKPKHFAILVGIAETIAMLGVALGEVLSAWMVQHYGWRLTMKISGVITTLLFFCAIIFILDKKRAFVGLNTEPLSLRQKIRFTLGNRQLWKAGLYGFAIINIINVFATLWSIPYLLQKYPQINLKMAGLATAMVFVGIAVGGPFNAWLTGRMNRRKPVLISFALMSALLFTVVLIIPISFAVMMLILLLLGFFSSSYIQVFALVKENTLKVLRGTALATVNMILMSSAPLMQSLTGWILSMKVPFYQVLMLINVLLYFAVYLSVILDE